MFVVINKFHKNFNLNLIEHLSTLPRPDTSRHIKNVESENKIFKERT